MFTSEDIQNIITFLGRVDLKGAEAPTLVQLVAKLNQAGQQAAQAEAAAKKAADEGAGNHQKSEDGDAGHDSE